MEFDEIFDEYVEVSKKASIDKETVLKYLTMAYTHIYLNDTSRWRPQGYMVPILDNYIKPERLEKAFLGYKYSLQFVWHSLLGKQYYSTCIRHLHTSKDWSIENDDSFLGLLKGKKPKQKKITKRDDLDSYFRKIQDEIIEPLERRVKVKNLGLRKILCLTEKIPKKSFGSLLKPLKESRLTEKEKLDYKLLWYQIEFLDSQSGIFNGVPAFISLLAGVAELKSSFVGGEKAHIAKFIHPVTKDGKKNDYSYGVLIEAFGSTGLSDFSGWVIFFDCCGDYSGFAGLGTTHDY